MRTINELDEHADNQLDAQERLRLESRLIELRPFEEWPVESIWKRLADKAKSPYLEFQKINRILAMDKIARGYRLRETAPEFGFTIPCLRSYCQRAGIRQRGIHAPVFIYALCCPWSKQAYYVGQSGNPWRRYTQHIANPVSPLMGEWIAVLAELRKAPRLKILACVDTDCPEFVEREWIDRLAAAGHPLMNREVVGWI